MCLICDAISKRLGENGYQWDVLRPVPQDLSILKEYLEIECEGYSHGAPAVRINRWSNGECIHREWGTRGAVAAVFGSGRVDRSVWVRKGAPSARTLALRAQHRANCQDMQVLTALCRSEEADLLQANLA